MKRSEKRKRQPITPTARLSVITPLHAPGNAFLAETYDRLRAQTCPAWEWVVLENHGGVAPDILRRDPRVRVLTAPADLDGIGALKRHASLLARGEFFVELDADDLLAPHALERTLAAFEGGADVVYSDFAEFERAEDGRMKSSHAGYPFGESFGWRSYPAVFEGHELIAMRAPEPTAHNVRRVEWAPNHLRAWRRSCYETIGGHDPALAVGDDHDLLVRLHLLGARFVHLPECLYFYRVHKDNTVATKSALIQDETARIYGKYIWALAETWAEDRKLLKIDLCGGIDSAEGYRVLDRVVAPGAGIAADLDGRWPLRDSSVGVLRAHDALEHLRDPVHTMNEAFRVLAPGGFFMISVPSTTGLGAFCDPTHVSFWNRLSFRYYCNKDFARYIPGFKGRFQASRLMEWYPSDWHRAEHVPYVDAHLFCCKDGFRAMGEWGWG